MVGTPEDQKFIRAAPAEEDAFLLRVAGAFRNDHESIPIFLACAVAFAALGGSPQIARWLFPAYVLTRIIHTIVYLKGQQPARFIAWAIGTVICGILVGAAFLIRSIKQPLLQANDLAAKRPTVERDGMLMSETPLNPCREGETVEPVPASKRFFSGGSTTVSTSGSAESAP